jgi:hypothetical protein
MHKGHADKLRRASGFGGQPYLTGSKAATLRFGHLRGVAKSLRLVSE